MRGVRLSLLAVGAASVSVPVTAAAAASAAPHGEAAAAAGECPAIECPAAHPAAGGGAAPGQSHPKVPTSAAKLLGQRIMVGLQGTYPDAGLLARVRAGEVGSVILFAANIVSSSQVSALTGALQRAARQGGNPPLLIATDQEGGQVKRFPNGPPYLSPPQMAGEGTIKGAYREGQLTGGYLRARGVNWDLAPVSDVPTRTDAFIWQQGRAFSFNPNTVAQYADAFARGLESTGVAATAKHFPGVGSATIDTDNKLDELRPTSAQLAGALKPYRLMIPRGLHTVMLSTAGFPAYDPTGSPAALSSRIARGLLRDKLGFQGVSITDALGTPTGHDEVTAGRIAARAGADVLLYTDSADGELSALESDLRAGRISRAAAVASYERIVALKRIRT
jgi:beta-N-acetylhexosaminidase